jgi:hypothetical protein
VKPRHAFARGGFAAAACVACCAPPIIGALGVTAGLAAAAGIFFGLAAAVAVAILGAGWIAARRRPAARSPRSPRATPLAMTVDAVPVAAPVLLRRRVDGHEARP